MELIRIAILVVDVSSIHKSLDQSDQFGQEGLQHIVGP